MKEFEVNITETLQKTVTVEAESREEAERMAEDMWRDEDIVLDAEDFTGVEFSGNKGKEAQKDERATMDVLMVEPGQYAKMTTIGSNLKSMQDAVGGSIEAAYFFDDPVALVCNEDGKNIGLPLNRAVRDEQGEIMDIIAGKFFVCGLTEDNFGSLPKSFRTSSRRCSRIPRAFSRWGAALSPFPWSPRNPPPRKISLLSERSSKDRAQVPASPACGSALESSHIP